MKVRLDFVHRNDIVNNNDGSNDEDGPLQLIRPDGPLQLIRPMPTELQRYIATQDYEAFCVYKIDPLLEALHKIETAPVQFRICYWRSIAIVCSVVSLYAVYVTGRNENMQMYKGLFVLLLIFCFILTTRMEQKLQTCQYPNRKVHHAIRQECQYMSIRCDINSRAMSTSRRHHIHWFELAMKNDPSYWGRITVSHINVSITEKNHDNDSNPASGNHYQHLSD
jgi:hypothetical protein